MDWDYIHNLMVITAMALMLGMYNLAMLPLYLIRWLAGHICQVLAVVLLVVIIWMIHTGPGFFGHW